MPTTVFTSESVCAGHPDKLCDQISDAILDAAIAQDSFAHVAVETLAAKDRLVLAGEITTTAKLNIEAIAREEIKRIGYTEPKWGFSHHSPISNYLHQQSPEIAVGVKLDGAGDQGMMFGFACNETSELMPVPIMLSHALTKRLDEVKTNELMYLRPDGKAQVSVEYTNGKPTSVKQAVIAVPHSKRVDLNQVKRDVMNYVVKPVLDKYKFKISPKDLIVNGTGVWHMPGPASDAGLTGRKIAVDSYGSYASLGGGAFSGKDPTKVDRSGAYGARYVAKNIVASGLAKKCEVRVAYYIGAHKPTMCEVETFGTETKSHLAIHKYINNLLDLSVRGIIETLDLRRPLYKRTAAYGHFGRNEFPWEQIAS